VIPLHGCEERHKKNTPNCVVRNTTNAKTDNHRLKRIWDMGNKQQTAVQWFLDQLIEHRIIIVDKTTYQVKYKHEILLEQAKEMEVMGKEMSYSDGYAEGYKRGLELIKWNIENQLKKTNENTNRKIR
jgi:hypothetical protein